jgi:tRNA (guanine37-N1)-methyltransferase
MRIDIITAVPALLDSPLSHSIMQRAQQKQLLEINVVDLRQYGHGKHKQIDDYQYGGGAGMVMMIEPLVQCLDDIDPDGKRDHLIYMTPDGVTLTQRTCNHLSTLSHLVIVCGHYKGVDERFREKYVTLEMSVGDYVLSGGELPAAILVDSIGRLIPGVLNDGSSALTDSHQDGLLAPPVYTRPATYDGMTVPDILLSGNDKAINEWREDQAVARTEARRPDMLKD